MASDTKRGYVSRLSPLAKPFILKTPKNSSSVLNSSLQDTGLSPSSSRLAHSFSSFSVEGKSAELGYKAHKSGDHQEIFHWKDKHGGFSMSNDDPTKQGSPTEGLKLRAETSDHVCKKFSGISRKDDEVRPKSTRQTDTQDVSFSAVKSRPISSKFSTSSDLHSSALVQDPQSGVPAISWSSDDSDIASFERRFSQQLDACTTKLNFSPSSDSNSLRALDSESSRTGSSDSPFNHALSQNLDSGGHGGVSKSGIFRYSLASLVDTAVDKSKEVFHDKVLTDKSKGKMGKPATQEVMEPLSMTKSELQITFPSHPIELASKSIGVKESDPIGNSSEIINENDSDLDSPCWKGKLSANQSNEVSRPDDFQHLKSARGACSNLNPLAPHFFPSCGKQKVNYRGTECEGDDSLTFQKTESSAVCLFSREHTLQTPGTAGSSSSDRSSITETHCSIDNHVPNKENEPLTNSSISSMLSSSCVVQPSILEDYFTSIGQLLTRQKFGGSGKVIEDAVPNGSTSVSLLASEHVRPISTRQIDSQHVSFSAVMSRAISSKFSPSPDLHSSALVQDPQRGVPAISWSSDDSDIASFERRFLQQLDACTTKVNFPPSSDSNSLGALDSESPGTGSSDSPFNHALSQNLDSGGHGGVSKSGIFRYSLASLVDTAVDKSKEVFHDKVLTDKSKGKMGKPATQEVMEPLSMTKSELQITFPSHPIELASKSLGVKESDPIGNSSEIINENDSDLDSPCWKGKLSANQSTCEVSRPDDFQHLKSARGACSNLNPLAPHFFPSCGKQKVNYRGTECEGDDSLTFQKTESSAVCLFSREHTLQKPGTAGSSSLDRSSITETHCSIENHVPNKESEPLTNSSTSSMLSSSCVVQPSILEDYFTSIGQLLTRQKVGGSGKVIEDAVPNGSTSVSLLASEHVRPISTRQIDSQHVSFSAVMSRPISSKFSPSSDLHSSALVQDPQSGVPAISWSSDDSDIASFERRFSQQLDACTTKVNFPPSSDSNSLGALDSESPGTGSSYSPFNHALSQNLDSGGHGGVRKSGIFWYSLASLVDAAVDKRKEVFHDKVLTDKSKGKMGKPATQEAMEPLSMTKSELQITCPSHPIELASKSLGVKENDPIGNSSEIINENDSDLDSPCWKGKLSANQSTCEVSRLDDFQHLKSARGACSNLNPLAPHFFPSCGKQRVNYCGTECEGDDSLTFQKTESSAVCLSSTEQTLQKTVTAGSSSSDQSSITETHCYIDMHVLNKELEQLTNSNSSSMLSSSCLVQPSIPEDYFISNSQLLTGKKVGGSGKFIEDAVSNGSTSVSLRASEHVTSSSSCRVGVSSALSEAYGLVTKPLCTPPKLDIQIVVKTINQVSELLMQNCSYDLDSLSEHEHDIMKRVVYNLNACIRNRV